MINGHRWCHAYVAHLSWLYFLLSSRSRKKKKFLTFVINGHKWLFFGCHVEPNDLWAAAWGEKLIKSEMAQIVTHLPFWFWNLDFGVILSSCVQFFFVCFVDISSYNYSRGALCPNSYLTYTTHIILLW